MSYKIEIKPAREGRLVKNLGGYLVVFRDGVGYTTSRRAAEMAEDVGFIVSDLDQKQEEVQEETPAPEAETEEPVEEVQEETEEEEEEEEEEEVEEEDPVVDVNALKEELGTWVKVAEHLGITTAQLKKLRDEA